MVQTGLCSRHMRTLECSTLLNRVTSWSCTRVWVSHIVSRIPSEGPSWRNSCSRNSMRFPDSFVRKAFAQWNFVKWSTTCKIHNEPNFVWSTITCQWCVRECNQNWNVLTSSIFWDVSIGFKGTGAEGVLWIWHTTQQLTRLSTTFRRPWK